jgi:RNA polymerase sigma-70 factor (ECF subfamily)
VHAVQPTDDHLVDLSLQGSREAFGVLVTRYARTVRAVCLARLGHHRDLEDVVQEAFLRAYHGLGRLKDSSRFGHYLHRIARNLCVDRLRRGERDAVSLDEVDLQPPGPRTPDEKEERLRKVRETVGRLPECLREAVLLFYFEKLSYARMAEMLGITEAAINQRLSRARRSLRESLGVQAEQTP